jgi:hypothetical protein
MTTQADQLNQTVSNFFDTFDLSDATETVNDLVIDFVSNRDDSTHEYRSHVVFTAAKINDLLVKLYESRLPKSQAVRPEAVRQLVRSEFKDLRKRAKLVSVPKIRSVQN